MRYALSAGILACLFDALTTWACLTSGSGYEKTPAVAHAIAAWGLIPALVFAALARSMVFGLTAVTATVARQFYWPLVGAIALGAAYTWVIVLSNFSVLTGGQMIDSETIGGGLVGLLLVVVLIFAAIYLIRRF